MSNGALDDPAFKKQVQASFDTVKKVLESRPCTRPRSLVVRSWPVSQFLMTEFIDLMSYQSEYADSTLNTNGDC